MPAIYLNREDGIMEKYRKILLLAVKIGIGSSIAIILARAFQLEYAASAGTVTLLTLMTSRWETIRLSVARLVTFAITILVSWIIFTHIESMWVCYGLALAVIVFLSDMLGWRATISVNAVVAAHLLTDEKFNLAAIWNELQLVLIGVGLALLLNVFYGNSYYKKKIVSDMLETEKRLQMILRDLAAFLSGEEEGGSAWDEICALKEDIDAYRKNAGEYQSNTFQSNPEYYADYFEMRWKQCSTLRNLYSELGRLRDLPAQAGIVSDYLHYLSDYVVETNIPQRQLERLDEMIEEIRLHDPPTSPEEFEGRAMLYHILMEIENFLGFKSDFVSSLDPSQLELYWKNSAHEEKSAAI